MTQGTSPEPGEPPDFWTLFDFLPIGAYRSSPEGRQLRANPAQVQLNGYASEAEMLAAVHDIGAEWYVAPGRRAEFRALLERDGFVKGFVSEVYRHKTRERIWVSENAHLVRDAAGRILFYEGTVEEVTERVQAEAALQLSEERLRQITSQVPGMVYRLQIAPDGTRRYSFVSSGVRELYGVEPQEVLADGASLNRMRHPDDRAPVDGTMDEVVRFGRPVAIEFRILPRGGGVKWVQMISAAVSQDEAGVVRNGVMIDITARKLAEAELHTRDEVWKLALDGIGDGVWDVNLQTGVAAYSRRCREMYGYAEDETLNLSDELDRRTHPDDVARMLHDRQAHIEGRTPNYTNEHRIRCEDGSWKWILSRGMVIARDAAGQPLRMVGTHTDITQRKQAEALIWQQANFDALTGLPNRRMLRDRLQQHLKVSDRDGTPLAVMFIDLDHFKEVNDTLGHDSGDLLLVEAAQRIGRCVRASDTVARMGGDEFTVVLADLAGPAGMARVEAIAQAILDRLSEGFVLAGETAFVSASAGITLYPGDATEIDALLRHADQALYVAKGAGRNRFSYFTAALQAAAQNRVRLANDLRTALALEQFHLVYQPIVELASGAVHKAEALIRWQHPVRGLVAPADFIPIAESNGLIVDIGEWVFREAAQQVRQWRAVRDPQFQISINKSPAQFHSVRHSRQGWFEMLAAFGMPPQSVVVEITEGLLLDTNTGIAEHLLALRDAGVGVSLDDFGTGYSSLSYLQRYDIDFIKIDRSFVSGLAPGSRDLALCKAIIVMAHQLGIRVIAEGVETAEQRELLLAAGCDYGQGYLFARPMPAEAFDALLEKETMRGS